MSSTRYLLRGTVFCVFNEILGFFCCQFSVMALCVLRAASICCLWMWLRHLWFWKYESEKFFYAVDVSFGLIVFMIFHFFFLKFEMCFLCAHFAWLKDLRKLDGAVYHILFTGYSIRWYTWFIHNGFYIVVGKSELFANIRLYKQFLLWTTFLASFMFRNTLSFSCTPIPVN